MVVCGQKSYGLDQKQASWDAVETLNIINPDRGCLTCVGFAPSQGRRCRNPIAQHNRTFAFKILNKISNEAPDGSALVADLRKIAATSLCLRYHQGQVDSVVAEWQSKIQSVKAQKASGTRKPYFGNSPYDSKPSTHKPSFSDFHSIEERLNDLMKKLAEYEVREQERKAEEERKRLRMEQKQKEKEMEEHKEKARQEKERKEQEKARKEAEEEQRKREEERNQEEEKQRKREEEERKQEEERKKHEEKAREQEEFNERARQRTQKAREEKERKEEQEGLEWKQAWNDYIDSWILFRSKHSSYNYTSILETNMLRIRIQGHSNSLACEIWSSC